MKLTDPQEKWLRLLARHGPLAIGDRGFPAGTAAYLERKGLVQVEVVATEGRGSCGTVAMYSLTRRGARVLVSKFPKLTQMCWKRGLL